jgi:hypothetical protein
MISIMKKLWMAKSSRTINIPSLAVLLLFGALVATVVGSLPVFAQEASSPPVTIKTNNESVNVVVSWEPQQIKPNQNVGFTLDFKHPSSGESLPHVNYNLEVMDGQGNPVESITDLHIHTQEMTFRP